MKYNDLEEKVTFITQDYSGEATEQLKLELFKFGVELFAHGYSLEDFISHIEFWAIHKENPSINSSISTEWINDTKEKFSGIDNIPSFAMALNIIDEPFLFSDIKNGYISAENESLNSDINRQNSKSM